MSYFCQIIKKTLTFFIYSYYCIRNRQIDYFNYIKISKNFPVFSISSQAGVIGNKCYGNINAVKNKLKNDFDKKCMIEHGLYFGEYVIKEECLIKNITSIYTYSPYRLEAIKKQIPNIDKNIITVGPYILYVKNFHNQQKLAQLKKKYGRILLVFPSHPFPGQPIEYNLKSFLSEIAKISHSFDTVFVSLHWLDIKNGLSENYKRKGYKIVCSGTRSDPYFLRRLKDLIELSDMTMSNDLGTHIGYCIALNRPHYLYKQTVCSKGNLQHENSSTVNNIRLKEKEIFYSFFSEYKEEITEEQRNIVKYYWG
jgi:hypothetical protein